MGKRIGSHIKLVKLTKNITFSSKKRVVAIVLGAILYCAAIIPGVVFLNNYLKSYLNYDNVGFHGDWVPNEDFCNLLEKFGLKIPACEQQVFLNYENITIRDVKNQNFASHENTDAKYNVLDGPNGLIESNNLRFEYAYNTVVKVFTSESSNSFIPEPKVGYVEGIYEDSKCTKPLQIEDVVKNNIQIKFWTVKLYSEKNSSNFVKINFPYFIFNNYKFLNNLLSFYQNSYSLNKYQKSSEVDSNDNQLNTLVLGHTADMINIPEDVFNSTDTGAINEYLYDYESNALNAFYKGYWEQFTGTEPVNSADNPLQNFILYSPQLNVLASKNNSLSSASWLDPDLIKKLLESILIDPGKTEDRNVISGINPKTLSKSTILTKLVVNINMLILPKDHYLGEMYKQTGGTEESFINFLTSINSIGDEGALEKAIEKYPFIQELDFIPFPQLSLIEEYNNHLETTEIANNIPVTKPLTYPYYKINGEFNANQFTNLITDSWNASYADATDDDPIVPFANLNYDINNISISLSSAKQELNKSYNNFQTWIMTKVQRKIYDFLLELNTNHSDLGIFTLTEPTFSDFQNDWSTHVNDKGRYPWLYWFNGNHNLDGKNINDSAIQSDINNQDVQWLNKNITAINSYSSFADIIPTAPLNKSQFTLRFNISWES